MPSLFMFGNKLIIREGIPIVRNDILPSGYNSAAIGGQPKWNGGYNFTSVGTNGTSSAYGTFDQTGNGFEWIDGSGLKVIRGGDIYGLGTAAGGYECSKLTRYTKTTSGGSANPSLFTIITNYARGKPGDKDFGGRLASSGNPLSLTGYVTVTDTGNAADTTGYGRVDYNYQINKYPITNNEYCNFLNAVATIPTSASTKDIAYGISNNNIIYEINLTDRTTTKVFSCNSINMIPDPQYRSADGVVITNALSFDTDNKFLYFLDREHNLYAWDLGSTLTFIGNINAIGSLGIPIRGPYQQGYAIGCASYYNGAIWVFNTAPGYTTQLVKINLSYSASRQPSISSINKYSTNIVGDNSFGDIAIDNNGILYASTTDNKLYTLNVNSPSNSYNVIKATLTPQFPATGFQVVFGRDYNTLYLHNYGDGGWYTVNKTNGTMSSRLWLSDVGPLIVPWGLTGKGFRDICGPNSIMVYNNLYSYQMNSERVGGINRSYNPNTNTFSYSVKTNYGNKPAYFLSWFDMARYSNWLHNNYGSLETGAYTLNGATTGIINRNPGATYWIPSENEWYKAAYYKGGSTNAGYWKFATRSDSTPIEVDASSIGDGTIKKVNTYLSLPTGINVSTSSVTDVVNNNTVSFIFDRVLTTGTTTVTVQPQYAKPGLPANFYLSNTLSSYSISTTASYSGNITVRYTLPSTISSGDFGNIKIFHKNSSNGKFEDATITTGIYARNFSTRTISAIVSNFSPFEVIPEEAPSATGLVLDTDPESSTYNTYISITGLNSPSGAPSGEAGASSVTGVSFPSVVNDSTWGRRILIPDATLIDTTFKYAASNSGTVCISVENESIAQEISDPNNTINISVNSGTSWLGSTYNTYGNSNGYYICLNLQGTLTKSSGDPVSIKYWNTYIESIFNVDAPQETIVMPVDTGNVTLQFIELTPGIAGQLVSSISTEASPASSPITVTTTAPAYSYSQSITTKPKVIIWE